MIFLVRASSDKGNCSLTLCPAGFCPVWCSQESQVARSLPYSSGHWWGWYPSVGSDCPGRYRSLEGVSYFSNRRYVHLMNYCRVGENTVVSLEQPGELQGDRAQRLRWEVY